MSLAFDSNQDGVFDVTDLSYSDFGVWQDHNSDGVFDSGEFTTLADAGIVAIDLVGDGVGFTTANGDVHVYSTTDVTFADGSVAIAQDVAFATSLPDPGLSSLDAAGEGASLVSVGTVAQDAQLPLASPLDSDGNGVLDAADTHYDSAFIWQDLNQDGIVSDGELTSLHNSHIQSVDLAGDGLTATTTDSYYHLEGAASVTYDDATSATVQDLHLASLIDHVIADPTVLDATALIATDPALDTTLEPTADLSHTVDTFLATEPVTDAHLATYEQDLTLSTDPTIPHDSASTSDTTTSDPADTTTDTAVYDPAHDSTVYDPTHDTVVHDTTTYDHLV